MENVILIVHLLLALSLIGVVLMQRSEGGGLGIGGGGGGGAFTARAAGTALGKITWVLAIAFICTSITLTILSARNAAGVSVTDRVTLPGASAPAEDGAEGDINVEGLLPPPTTDGEATDAPLVPRAD